jgi:hypothetical protein
MCTADAEVVLFEASSCDSETEVEEATEGVSFGALVRV